MNDARIYTLYLAVSADPNRYETVENEKSRIAPSAYAVSVPARAAGRIFWGEGYISNSEALFAHGVMHILDEILIDELDEISGDEDNFKLNVLVKNTGADKYVTEHVRKWLSENDQNRSGTTPNNFKVWKRFYLLSQLGKIQFIECNTKNDKKMIKLSREAAAERIKSMPDCEASSREGMINTGELSSAGVDD